MVLSRSQPSWLSTFFSIVTILTLSAPVQSLYFYIHGRQPKCFYEELPKDTLVVGNYQSEAYSPHLNAYAPDSSITITITVDEVFDNDHRVVSQKGADKGRYTFSTADAGQHKLCFTADSHANSGWLSGASGPVRLTLDMAIGESNHLESEDKSKLDDLVERVKNLNGRLQDIRREQVFQREREAQFRDQSEATNSRVVRWALIQTAVLGVTCVWQFSHLRSFFIKQKLT
ncbi:Emp24/gp25L/p24 membrane trafficking protein [Trichophyton tonsurans CBS 112818]|uniref:ERP6 n=2 Tax=Trichophyton TaxID=5550 RepID=F2PMH2_TRIEC|nr:Emp24/gp25L/p24 membrane trafficking protein [Trichophyton tonsurans CBS 112818]EGE03069.1 ERP6 [Trichophyton equinum CBS 127.97]